MHLSVTTSLLIDSSGATYLGCHIKHTAIIRYLRVLRRMLGNDIYNYYRDKKRERDQGVFHITLINPIDYPNLRSEQVDVILNKEFKIQLYGIGRAQDAYSICYYIIVRSEELQKCRSNFALDQADLHITLGFSNNDVYGIEKGRGTLIKAVGELPLEPIPGRNISRLKKCV